MVQYEDSYIIKGTRSPSHRLGEIWPEPHIQQLHTGTTQGAHCVAQGIGGGDGCLKLEYRGKIAARQSMGLELRDIRGRIVHCIRGHEDFGEDSEFYRFLGFKTKAERKSGLTRKSTEESGAELPKDDTDGLEDAA
jgi:hypothetical protein